MSEIAIYNIEGKKTGTVSLPDELFAAKVVKSVLHDVIRAEEAAKRQGNAATKTRAEVSGGGKKPWKQKGTGRARHGSTRSPIWVGGGTTFGPQPRDYTIKINRKVRRQALAGALTSRMSEERLIGIDPKGIDQPSTAQAAAFLKNFENVKKPMLVYGREDDAIVKSFRNIKRSALTHWDSLGARAVLTSDFLIFTPSALERVKLRENKENAE